MNLSIYTQTDEVVNFNNITTLSPVSGEYENENGDTPIEAFGVVASDLNGIETQLGVYDTEEQLLDVMNLIKRWLVRGIDPVFVMPLPEDVKTGEE